MATQKTYKINIDVESKTLGQLENDLAQINEELKNVDRNSQAFKNLSSKAQVLTNEIEETNKAIEGIKLEDKLDAADGAIKIFAGSLQTVVGTLGAIGVESEVFGEFEEKAASAIAVGMGIKDVSEGFGKVFPKTTAKAVTAVQTFAKGTSRALIATGIGAFVVAMGAIVANWDSITAGIKKVIASSKGLTNFFNGVKAGFKSIFESIRPVLEFFDLYPTLEEEAAEVVRKSNEEQIPKLEQKVKLLQAQKKSADEIYDAEKKLLDARIAAAETDEDRLKAQNELAILNAANDARIDEERKQRAKDREDKEKENLEKKKANEQEAFDFLTELQKEEEDLRVENDEQKLALEQERVLKEIDLLKVSEDEKATLRLQAEENYNLKLQDLKDQEAEKERLQTEQNQTEINDVLQQIGLDRIEDTFERAREELRIEEEKEIARLTLLGATEEEITKIKDGFADKQNQIAKAQADFETKTAKEKQAIIVDAAAQTFGNLSAILGEESKAGKAAAIAETVIRTYQSAQSAYSSLAGIPIVGPALGAIAAAAAVAAGIANVNKIKSTPVPGGGGGGGPSVSPSRINPVEAPQSAPRQFDAPQTFQQTGPTVKAYVLSGDVKSSTEADAKIERRRTID